MSIKNSFFLERDKAVLVVIDVQEKLCVAMDEAVLKQLVKNIGILLESAVELNIPVLVTEQYVKGLGPTLSELKKKAASASALQTTLDVKLNELHHSVCFLWVECKRRSLAIPSFVYCNNSYTIFLLFMI